MQKRILAVEDDPDILFVVQYLLAEQGYQVYTSIDGEEILSQVQQLEPDLILMDIMLPNNDGRLLCKGVKNYDDTIPVILMSANIDLGLQQDESCADDFIAKPFDVDFFLEKIASQLAN